jgi:hypothetical protein
MRKSKTSLRSSVRKSRSTKGLRASFLIAEGRPHGVIAFAD